MDTSRPRAPGRWCDRNIYTEVGPKPLGYVLVVTRVRAYGGSGFWLQFEQAEGFGLESIRFGYLLEGRTRGIGHDLMGTATACRQVGEQGGEAMSWPAVSGLMCLLFGLGGRGGFGGLDRVALPPILFQFF